MNSLETKGGTKKILTSTDLYEFVKMLTSEPLTGEFDGNEPGSEFVLLGK